MIVQLFLTKQLLIVFNVYSFWFSNLFLPDFKGVHTVGCIGRQHGLLKYALPGAYLPYLFYTADNPYYYFSSVLAALTYRAKVKWRKKPSKRRHICK